MNLDDSIVEGLLSKNGKSRDGLECQYWKNIKCISWVLVMRKHSILTQKSQKISNNHGKEVDLLDYIKEASITLNYIDLYAVVYYH